MFSETLTKLLKSRNMNPLSLAKDIGVPKSIVYEWRQGAREPSMENLLKLSDYFGVSLEYLTGRSETEQPEYSQSSDEAELLVLLRSARKVSEKDHNALVRSFKTNLDAYLKSSSRRRESRERIEREAVKLLLMQELKGEYALSFLDCKRIKTGGIATIDSMSSYEKQTGTKFPFRTDGMTVKQGELNMIFYDDSIDNASRVNWTIAHELGHILLLHTDNSELSQRQADQFAASLLMPDAVIRFLDCQNGSPISAEEMTKYFSASYKACSMRRQELDSYSTYVPTADGTELVRRLFDGGK